MGLDGSESVFCSFWISNYVHSAAADRPSRRIENLLRPTLSAPVSSLLSGAAGVLRGLRECGNATAFKNSPSVRNFSASILAAADDPSDDRPASGLGGHGLWRSVVLIGGRVFLYSLGSAGHIHARAPHSSTDCSGTDIVADTLGPIFLSRPERGPGIVPGADGFARRRMPGGYPVVGPQRPLASPLATPRALAVWMRCGADCVGHLDRFCHRHYQAKRV